MENIYIFGCTTNKKIEVEKLLRTYWIIELKMETEHT